MNAKVRLGTFLRESPFIAAEDGKFIEALHQLPALPDEGELGTERNIKSPEMRNHGILAQVFG
ncbi:MAG TPA: hypothetical protein VN956_08480 [Pyrinomonadaceae bacterium]|nr:hypothetical protein [Pyrinomonadaceae bacterium]